MSLDKKFYDSISNIIERNKTIDKMKYLTELLADQILADSPALIKDAVENKKSDAVVFLYTFDHATDGILTDNLMCPTGEIGELMKKNGIKSIVEIIVEKIYHKFTVTYVCDTEHNVGKLVISW